MAGSRRPRFFGGGEARPRRDGGCPLRGGTLPGLPRRKTPSHGRLRPLGWFVGDLAGEAKRDGEVDPLGAHVAPTRWVDGRKDRSALVVRMVLARCADDATATFGRPSGLPQGGPAAGVDTPHGMGWYCEDLGGSWRGSGMEISGESVKKCKKIAKKCKYICIYGKKVVSLQRISIVEYITIKITQEL